MKILMFVRREPKFQCLEGQSQNFNDSKDKRKNLMGGSIRSEIKCLEG